MIARTLRAIATRLADLGDALQRLEDWLRRGEYRVADDTIAMPLRRCHRCTVLAAWPVGMPCPHCGAEPLSFVERKCSACDTPLGVRGSRCLRCPAHGPGVGKLL